MEKGAASASAAAGAGDSNGGLGAALVSAAPRQAPTNSRRRISGTQQLVAHIFQNVGGAFDADFACENRILILDAEDAYSRRRSRRRTRRLRFEKCRRRVRRRL